MEGLLSARWNVEKRAEPDGGVRGARKGLFALRLTLTYADDNLFLDLRRGSVSHCWKDNNGNDYWRLRLWFVGSLKEKIHRGSIFVTKVDSRISVPSSQIPKKVSERFFFFIVIAMETSGLYGNVWQMNIGQ